MNFYQTSIIVRAPRRGAFAITEYVLEKVDISMIDVGIMHLFLKHTSASLFLNETFSYDVAIDLENISKKLVPDGYKYCHINEGADDMPAHFKSAMFGTDITIPITNGKLNIGSWQGIYLMEHKDYPRDREIVVTIMWSNFDNTLKD